MPSLLKTIEKEFKALMPVANQKFLAQDYVGGGTSHLMFLNIKIPLVRSYLGNADFKKATWADMQELWYKSNIFEVKALALFWLEKQNIEFLLKNISSIIRLNTGIDNWAHSDTYSGILARIYEESPKALEKTYLTWNKSKNPWQRRISMVGLLFYSRCRKKYPQHKKLISFVKPHLTAEEYYVQKAVGWTLREIYNLYPKETLSFVEKEISNIHPHAWYATSEKMPKSTKNKLVELRKKHRTQKKKS